MYLGEVFLGETRHPEATILGIQVCTALDGSRQDTAPERGIRNNRDTELLAGIHQASSLDRGLGGRVRKDAYPVKDGSKPPTLYAASEYAHIRRSMRRGRTAILHLNRIDLNHFTRLAEGCGAALGKTDVPEKMSATLPLQTDLGTRLIFPDSCSSFNAPAVSSIGVSLSTRCA
jgi:hypothetical protein